jgi:hypothetical protein
VNDLVSWLRTRLDEDERVALEAAHHDRIWQYADSGSGPTVRTGSLAEDLWSREGNPSVWTCDDIEDGCPDVASAWEAEGQHIARWDPARVLAEVKAKRRILDEYQTWCESSDSNRDPVDSQAEHDIASGLELAIKLLAQPYAGQPGWREEWQLSEGA